MADRGMAITFNGFTTVIYLFFYFVSMDDRPAMGSQPHLASRLEEVSFYKCPQKFRGLPPNLGCKKTSIFGPLFSTTSALGTAYLRNETLHQQTEMLVSIYNVSPKGLPTFRNLWPRNGWDLFTYCDLPFCGHYVKTVKVLIKNYGGTARGFIWGSF